MQPRYVLPSADAGRNINLDLRPKQVAAWLNRLPLSNPLEAAEELSDYLATVNSNTVAHDLRLNIAQALGPAVDETFSGLREHYAGAPLPLAQRLRPYPMMAERMLVQLATCYKILIHEWLNRTFRFSKKQMPLYLQQVLVCSQQIMEISFETHESVPKGIWVDLHQTYNYALHAGFAEVIPEDSRNTQPLEQIYKSTLLMALADPYHFPHIELPWAKDIIARYSNLAHLFPAEESKGQAGLFIIEVNTDAPPRPVAWQQHPMNPRWDLMLNTTELAKHLAMLSTHVKGTEDPQRLGLPAAARDPEYAVMLRRLKLNWGASIQRQSQRRHHQRGREFQVGFGLRSMYQLINAGGARDTQLPRSQGEDTPPLIMRCLALDDSMGGLALRRSGGAIAQIKVGDLVGIRQDSGFWSLGMVRWFRVPAAEQLHFGIQLLAPKAMAVQIQQLGASKFMPGLLVQASVPLKQSAMLLCLPGNLQPEEQLHVRSGSGGMSVRVDKRLEHTPSIEIFRITVA